MDERPYQENQGRGRDAALVLGILSIIFIFICQLVGLVLGIIGLHKTRKDRNGGTDTAWVLNVLGIVLNSVILFLFAAALIFGLIAFSGFMGHMHMYHMW